jgi:hypothetical protein
MGSIVLQKPVDKGNGTSLLHVVGYNWSNGEGKEEENDDTDGQ